MISPSLLTQSPTRSFQILVVHVLWFLSEFLKFIISNLQGYKFKFQGSYGKI